jgi:hypothetical protein
MAEEASPADERVSAGLCADCQNARRISSDRGSRFYLCERGLSDRKFPKYPRLPVVVCPGYARLLSGNSDPTNR